MTPLVRWKNFILENFKEVLGYYKDEYKGKTWKEVEDLIDSENKGYKRTSYQFCGQLSLEYKEGHKKNLFKIQDYLLKFSDEELKKYLKFWFMTYYAPNVRVAGEESAKIIYIELLNEILSKDTLKIKEEESSLFNHGSKDILRNCFIDHGEFINYDSETKEYFIEVEKKEEVKLLKSKIEKYFSIPKDFYSLNEFFERYSEENYKLFYLKVERVDGLKEEFEKWLADSRNLSLKSIDNYLNRSLPYISRNMKKFNLSNKDSIFQISNPIEAQSLFINFFEIPELKEANEKGKRFYSSPFNNYIKFLEDMEKKQIKYTKIIDFSYNRIVYGAPGTGKSYLLNRESKEIFKDLVIENVIEETEDTVEDKRFWGVGAKWSLGDQTERFLKEGVWENGYSDKYLEKVKEIQKGDLIAIKSSFTRKKSDGKFISVLRTKALGVVKKNYNDGKKLDVEWVDTEDRDYDGISYRLTVHEVAEKFLHIFNPINNLNKVVYIEKKEVTTVERVTFYDGYTYGQFVGSYKPVPKGDSITYEYVAGPFMRQLVKAYKNPNDNFCLIIEEINRARADKVFGNIFQLLDRGEDGKSQYPVSLSEEQILYLQKEMSGDDQEILDILLAEGLYIPKNLYIWATMNSADQGVYPLDTAFKRRWSFEHLGLNENEKEMNGLKISLEEGLMVEWNEFRREINKVLLSDKVKISEDRLLAPFFVKKDEFKDEILDTKVFADKILVYLFDDVLRHKNKEVLFEKGLNSFSKLKEKLDLEGSDKRIFKSEFYEKFNKKINQKLYSSDEGDMDKVAEESKSYNTGEE